MNYKDCDCKEWKIYGQMVWNAQMIALTHPHLLSPYPCEGVFLYCPWCGKKRGVDSE